MVGIASDALVGPALDPSRGELAEAAAHPPVRVDRALDVVLGPAEGELRLLEGRPRRTRVAVERHPDAAGVEQIGAVRPRAPELLVAVTEDDCPVVHAVEVALLVRLRLWREALDV